jgi:hypothetical protein
MYDSEPAALEHLLPMIGTLIFAFAHLETVMTSALKVTLTRHIGHEGYNYGKAFASAHAIIGGNRYSASRDMWNRLLKALRAKPSQVAYYKAVFGQLGEISFFRDRLAHQYTFQARHHYDGLWINSDFASMRNADGETPILFPAKVVLHAAEDVIRLRDAFDGCFDYCVVNSDRRIPYGVEPPTFRYKPSMLVRGRQSVEALLEGKSPPPQSWTE